MPTDTSTGGWGGESGLEVGSESEKGRWIHMLYRQAGKRGELFIDGKRVKTSTTMASKSHNSKELFS